MRRLTKTLSTPFRAVYRAVRPYGTIRSPYWLSKLWNYGVGIIYLYLMLSMVSDDLSPWWLKVLMAVVFGMFAFRAGQLSESSRRVPRLIARLRKREDPAQFAYLPVFFHDEREAQSWVEEQRIHCREEGIDPATAPLIHEWAPTREWRAWVTAQERAKIEELRRLQKREKAARGEE